MSLTLSRRARFGLGSATLLCLMIGAYGVALAASGFAFLADDIAANGFPLAVKVHIATASAALLLLPWQLWPAIRNRLPAVHRWVGRGYVATAVVGGLSGIGAGLFTANGPIAAAGFTMLGVLWTTTTVAAYAAARRRDFVAHRRWATRSFALAFAAVTLRLWLPISAIAGISYAVAYPVVAWLCWVPNLLLAERALRRSAAGVSPSGTAVPRSSAGRSQVHHAG
jgi:uncharacterized membrane protein